MMNARFEVDHRVECIFLPNHKNDVFRKRVVAEVYVELHILSSSVLLATGGY